MRYAVVIFVSLVLFAVAAVAGGLWLVRWLER